MFQLSSDCEVELDGFNYEEYQGMLREILENLPHVKKLMIGQWCIQVLSICEMRGLPSPMSNCHHLILDTCLNSWDFPGIASLLRCSSDLETLVIDITPPRSTKFVFDVKSSRKID
ncbi:putative F-box/LRR-repeat protein At3g28410 isoform X2 [Rhododendron vialii]|uniref:putative F-box/LRR-repeat protein At3g28410 isoform X2 n=1 Tax=Rhododendron vialii TaxID=182163 RepID=UPI00265DB2F9|nr:putative F-box/LRR-repeat protein At3g28410 isoform X2 [Rhododendron vialii]